MKITKKRVNKPRQVSQTSLVEYEPFRGMLSLRDAMDRLFDESFWAPFGVAEKSLREMERFMPKVDISETDTEVKVRADIPGIDPQDLNIEVTEDTLTLSGKSERTEEEKKENYYRLERQSGEFFRELMLPCKIDTDKVDASAKNGVVTITLQKQPSEQKKKVKVKV